MNTSKNVDTDTPNPKSKPSQVPTKNWARNMTFSSSEHCSPSSLEELQTAVARASKLKAVGTAHSFSDVANTDGTLIITDQLNRVLNVSQERMQVTVEAGIKLHELNQVLDKEGMSLASLGDIDRQSVAGVMSTGTHGTGMQWGSLADASVIVGVDLVVSDGSLVSLSEEKEEDRETLQAVRLGLGVLGVIYAVTIQCVPSHNLELRTKVIDLEEALDPKNYQENDHFEFFNFPFSSSVLAVYRNITDEPVKPNSVHRFFNEIIMENVVLDIAIRMMSVYHPSAKTMMPVLPLLAGGDYAIDKSHRIMVSRRMIRFYETEYCLPIDNIKDVLSVYADMVTEFAQKSGRDRYVSNFPGEIRYTRGDQGNLLSPTQGKPSVYFAVQSHTSFGDSYQGFFKEIGQVLRSKGGRPHWGKMFFDNPSSCYPEFHRFESIRKRLDPNGKFINAFYERLLS